MSENKPVKQTRAAAPAAAAESALRPRVEVFEDAEGITLIADLPGVPSERLNVQVDKDTLLIEGTADIAMPTVASRARNQSRIGILPVCGGKRATVNRPAGGLNRPNAGRILAGKAARRARLDQDRQEYFASLLIGCNSPQDASSIPSTTESMRPLRRYSYPAI